jgi:hypothetical protein
MIMKKVGWFALVINKCAARSPEWGHSIRSLDKRFLRIKETLKRILSKGVFSSLDAQKMLIKATLAV